MSVAYLFGVALLLSQPPAMERLSAEQILERVESNRLRFKSGRLQLDYSDALDGKPRYHSRLLGEFWGADQYALEIRELNALPPQDDSRPQCIQVFDGAKIMRMIRNPSQQFSIHSQPEVNYQFFNPLWLGLLYFPVPTQSVDAVLFWREKTQARYIGHENGLELVEVNSTLADGALSVARLWIDPMRGWNVVRIRARLSNGYEVEVDSELRRFDGRWFPSHVVMRQGSSLGARSMQAEVTVLDAEFNLPMDANTFTLKRLGPPDTGVPALVQDWRVGQTLQHGFWDGESLKP